MLHLSKNLAATARRLKAGVADYKTKTASPKKKILTPKNYFWIKQLFSAEPYNVKKKKKKLPMKI